MTVDTGASIFGASTIGEGTRISSGAKVIGDVTIGSNVRISIDSDVRIDITDNVGVSTDAYGWHTITHKDGEQFSVNPRYRDRNTAPPITASQTGWVATTQKPSGPSPTNNR